MTLIVLMEMMPVLYALLVFCGVITLLSLMLIFARKERGGPKVKMDKRINKEDATD